MCMVMVMVFFISQLTGRVFNLSHLVRWFFFAELDTLTYFGRSMATIFCTENAKLVSSTTTWLFFVSCAFVVLRYF